MKYGVLVLFSLIPFLSFSQESDLGNWLIYIGNKKVSEKLNWHNEVQYRNYNAVGDLEQLLLRTGLGMNVGEKQGNLLLGYAYIHSQNYVGELDDKQEIDEHRIFQQFITRQKVGSAGLQHRYRFEQRFIEEDFRLRFRYFLSVSVPLNRKEMLDNTLYLSAYNEIFLNTENTIFDRNRLYGGLGFKVNNKIRLELGYMNQFLGSANRDQINVFTFLNF